MSKKNVIVSNVSEGHDNPIAELVQVACQFDSDIMLESDNRRINAKSIMGIMAFMTMWNISSRKVLPCLRLAGQTGTVLSRQVSICCLQPLKATVIMKFQITLTTGQTAISSVNQV